MSGSRYVLGLSAYYHDSAACLLNDGEIVAATLQAARREGDIRREQPLELEPRLLVERDAVEARRIDAGLAEAVFDRALREGRIVFREDVAEGIEAAPRAFIGMLSGANRGKQLVCVAQD